MFYDDDADLSLIQGKNVAVIGYGSQGHAHALSLRDSGVDVRVGLQPDSKSRAKAEAEGLRVLTPAEAAEEADVIVILAPDQHQRKLYAEEIEPNIAEGDTLVFGHGFNIRFGYITPPRGGTGPPGGRARTPPGAPPPPSGRLQTPAPATPPRRGCERLHGRAEGPRSPGASRVRRRPGSPGPRRGREGPVRRHLGPRAVLRQ